MTQRHLDRDKTPPLWAVLGAPLIGVPIMVGLLALAAPKAQGPTVEPAPVFVTEPVDAHVVEPASSDSEGRMGRELDAG